MNPPITERQLQGIVLVAYVGEQEDGHGDTFSLYTLLDDLPEHPIGSTVSAHTLYQIGYGFVEMNRNAE